MCAELKPYYQDKFVTIYHGDCREILPELPKVDLVLTDPPYGIGDRMQGGTWGSAKKYSDFRKWDIKPNEKDLIFQSSFGTNSIIWGGNYFSLPASRGFLIWDKKNAVNTMADCEYAWTNLDKPAKRFSCGVGIHKSGHPTEKPVELFTWCISQVEKANTIIDFYMGSGTTLVAAKQLNRHAIGIEIEEKYCEIAANRCCQEVMDFTINEERAQIE